VTSGAKRLCALLASSAVVAVATFAAAAPESRVADAAKVVAARTTKALGVVSTVDERVAEFGPKVDARLKPKFSRAGVGYPPREVALLVFKDARRLDVYAKDAAAFARVASYPIRGMSGVLGPKLKEGDRQAPEGIYAVPLLNPNSAFHVSLRLDYPNAFDRAEAAAEGRRNLGGDIMIHGGSASIGCFAMGDDAAEDLFVLAARTGLSNVRVVSSPTDFRDATAVEPKVAAPFAARLYASLREELRRYPKP
jgi:hypothetical protein